MPNTAAALSLDLCKVGADGDPGGRRGCGDGPGPVWQEESKGQNQEGQIQEGQGQGQGQEQEGQEQEGQGQEQEGQGQGQWQEQGQEQEDQDQGQSQSREEKHDKWAKGQDCEAQGQVQGTQGETTAFVALPIIVFIVSVDLAAAAVLFIVVAVISYCVEFLVAVVVCPHRHCRGAPQRPWPGQEFGVGISDCRYVGRRRWGGGAVMTDERILICTPTRWTILSRALLQDNLSTLREEILMGGMQTWPLTLLLCLLLSFFCETSTLRDAFAMDQAEK